MSNVFTLEDLDAAIEKEYAPLVFKVGEYEYTMVSVLRLDKKVRDDVREYLQKLEGDDTTEEEALEAMQYVFKAVTKDGKGKFLVEALGNDIIRNMMLLKQWSKATQAGEVSDSPS